ncbi:MAG TPA: hypothetical protein GX717_02290 [Clostridiaceae bacterium]|nr:hypothetical protein [Clostridiaceae bacterium]
MADEKNYPLNVDKVDKDPIEDLKEVYVASPFDSRVNKLDAESFDDREQEFQAIAEKESKKKKEEN